MCKSKQLLLISEPENSMGKDPWNIEGHWAEPIHQLSQCGEFCFLKGRLSRNINGGAA
jgi:hypothetical protein